MLATFNESESLQDKRDILDLLKLSYIVVRTGIATTQLQQVSRAAHTIWTNLRESLIESPLMGNIVPYSVRNNSYFYILDKCAKSSSHDAENCNCRNIGWCEGGSKDNFLEERRGTSEECAMGGLLLSQLHTVMQVTL